MIFAFPILIAGFANLALAFLLISFRKTKTTKVFAFYNVCLAVWNIGAFCMYFAPDTNVALMFHKLLLFGLLFLFPSFYHFVLLFTNNRIKIFWFLLRLAYLTCAVLFLSGLFDFYWIKGLVHYAWGYYPVRGPLTQIFDMVFAIYVPMSLILLYKRSNEVDKLKSRQLKLIFWSMISFFAMATTNFIPMYGIQVYPLGHLFNALSSALITYTILNFQTFDIYLVLRKGIVFSTLIFVVLTIYGSGLLFFGHFLHREFIPDDSLLSMFLISGAMVMAVYGLRPIVERLTDRLFHMKSKNLIEEIDRFNRKIFLSLNKNELEKNINESFNLSLRVPETHLVYKKLFLNEFPFWELALAQKSNIYLDEINQLIEDFEDSEENFFQSFNEVFSHMKSKKIEALISFSLDTGEEYLLKLSQKLSQEPFTKQEKKLINASLPTLISTMKNVKHYQENIEKEKLIQKSQDAAAIGVLARGLAHEIKNPLMSIKSFFDLSPHQNEKDRNDFLKIASKELNRIQDLLEKLKHFHLSEEMKMSEINFREFIKEINHFFKNDALKYNIKFEYIDLTSSAQPLILKIDTDKIKQVIINIIINAFDVVRAGGSISLILKTENSRVILSIKDTGIGMSPKVVGKIFEPFFTSKKNGTGLGLYIAKNIITAHQGTLDCVSLENKGTVFIISLPF